MDVSKTYESGIIFKRRRTVLEGISLEVKEGETVGLLGRSGSGKTTLGKVLSGLESPSGGKVLFNGINISDMNRTERLHFRRSVQMVFQDPEGSLNPKKSIDASLSEVLRLMGVPKSRWREKVMEILDAVSLSPEVLCRYPHQLSGGQNQRIVLGRVLLLEPEVIILDEPTSSLDISVQAQILNLLKDLQRDKGLAYLFISHQEEVIRFMTSHVRALEGGELVEVSP